MIHITTNIIIPTYKEKDNLERLIININRCWWLYNNKYNVNFRIIDDTPDNSLLELIRETRITYMKGNGNYGDSLISGMLRADGMGNFNKMIIMDIDHPFDKIPDMIDMLDTYDVVIGNDINENKERYVTKFILKRLFGIDFPHPTCGFMGFNHDIIGYKTITDATLSWFYAKSKRDVVHVEFLYMAIKKKLKIGVLDFNTTHLNIKHNYSIKRSLIWLKDVMNMFLWDRVLNWYNQ
jgi:hypothetical protein